MTVPSKDEFKWFIDYLTNNRPESSLAPIAWEDYSPTEDELYKLFNDNYDLLDRVVSEQYSQTAVGNWLTAQPFWKVAYASAFKAKGKRPKPSDVNPNNSSLARIEAHKLHANLTYFSPIENFHIITRRLNEFWDYNYWGVYIARAIYEYFYTNHATEGSGEFRKKVMKAHDEAIQAINSLAEIVGLLKDDPYSRTEIFRFNHERNSVNIIHQTILLELKKLIGRHPWLQKPVSRADETVKEKLLVYRFWEFNKRSRLFPPSVVVDIMHFEGVNHQYDLRTIERLYAKFKSEKGQTR